MPDSLFQYGGRVVQEARGRFSAQDQFVPGIVLNAKVRIVYLSNNFLRWFGGKVEEPSAALSLAWYELQRNAGDRAIIAELTGDTLRSDKLEREFLVETTLGGVFSLMEKQRRGQSGPLASNGWGNDFYVRDVSGQLRSVYVHWCDQGWGVDSLPIIRTSEWPIRDRVFVLARD